MTVQMGLPVDLPTVAPELTVGIDEAGRGCLAGPVVAGAVILPDDYYLPGLDDSKTLSPEERDDLAECIKADAIAWAVGVIDAPVIDEINILQATFRAMWQATLNLDREFKLLLIDGDKTLPKHVTERAVTQQAIIKGDSLIPAISAASIIAKTHRDHYMVEQAAKYPAYGFENHMGYGTKAHRDAIREHGPCPLHRMSFKGVKPEKVGKTVQKGLFD